MGAGDGELGDDELDEGELDDEVREDDEAEGDERERDEGEDMPEDLEGSDGDKEVPDDDVRGDLEELYTGG